MLKKLLWTNLFMAHIVSFYIRVFDGKGFNLKPLGLIICLATLFQTGQASANLVQKKSVKRPLMQKHVKIEKAFLHQSTKAPIFEVNPGVPQGFKTLAMTESNFVSVYFHGKLLANANASFDQKTIKFKFPEALVKNIPNLKSSAITTVQKVLSMSLDNQQQRLCPYGSTRIVCTPPSPKITSIVFNPASFRAELFINPQFIVLKKKQAFKILPSTSGFSYIDNNNVTTTGKTGNQRSNTTSISTMNILAYKNNALEVDAAFTNTTQKGFKSTNQLDISNFSYSTVLGQRKLSAGMIQSVFSNFITSKYLLGVSLTNNGFFNDPTADEGTQIPIFLASQSKVDIYYGKVLEASKYYQAGRHYLDTSSLQEGAYTIRVLITDQSGKITSFKRFFVKLGNLPKLGDTYYQTDFGLIEDNNYQDNTTSSNSLTVPHFTKKSLFDINVRKRLTQNTGLSALVQTNFHELASSLGLSLQYGQFKVDSGFVFGTKDTYGLRVQLGYQYKEIGTDFNATKIFSGKTKEVDQPSMLTFPPGYDLHGDINFPLGKTSVSLGAGVQHYNNKALQKRYNAELNRTLYSGAGGTLSGYINAIHSYDDSSITLSLTFNFTVPNVHELSGNLTLGAERYYPKTEGTTQLSSNIGLDKNWAMDDNNQKVLSTHFDYSQNHNSRTFGLNSSYFRHEQNLGNIGITYYVDNNSLGYSAHTQFSFVNAGGEVGLSPSMGMQNGLLVRVRAPKDVAYQVYVDQNTMSGGFANHTDLVSVSPYMPHEISIVQTGQGIYKYDTAPKEVNLYEGNVQALNWTLAKQYILFAQVVDAHKHSLGNLLLEGVGEFNQTGQDGYFQANITDNTKTLNFRSIQNKTCAVNLPKNILVKDGLAMLDKPLLCKLQKLKPKLKKQIT